METYEKHDFPKTLAVGPPPERYDRQLLIEMAAAAEAGMPVVDDYTVRTIESLKRLEAARAREDAKPPAEAPVKLVRRQPKKSKS